MGEKPENQPRSSQSHPGSVTPGTIILFDGVCNLCNASVLWLIKRDTRGVLRFAALQSAAGQRVMRAAGWSDEQIQAGANAPDSVILVDQGRVYERSDAALVIAGRLGLPWSLARVGWVVPRFMRDGVYRWVARNRYRWFGKREACMVPTPELRARFMHGSSAE
jgi:predicted DCC family thiol-disulfide oxidoreductase YuxK